MCSLLNIKGVVLPLTEERADLVGHSETEDYFGEVVVSQNIKNISTLSYDHDITIGNEVRKGIAEAHRAAAGVSDLFLPDGELRESA